MAAPDFGLVIQTTPTAAMDPMDLNAYNRAAIETVKNAQVFSTIWAEDHFQWENRPTLEAFTTLAYLCAQYPNYRFGSLVFGQSYRNPALLAKMSATLQYLSGGRFVLGIGAGWKEDEYRAYGYPYPPAGVRIAELAEAIQALKALWAESPATFHGEHYRIEQAYCEPRPQRPIPVLVGGAGERGTLRVVARHADAWNHDSCSFEEYAHKVQVLRRHCEEVGRDVSEIQLTYYGHVDLTTDPQGFQQPADNTYVLGPTTSDIATQLRRFIELGVRHIMIQPKDLGSLRRFCSEVIPALTVS